jgi:uncharacterized phage-associated protein
MSFEANKISDTIIALATERGDRQITNLKLQKLLYYTQAWYLAFTGQPLFSESIEAWVHGPVVPSEFRRYREFRWNPIDSHGEPCEDAAVLKHIEAVFDAYGKFSATQLERLTHREDPWKNARRGLEPDIPSRNVIPHAAMRDYYHSRLVASSNG